MLLFQKIPRFHFELHLLAIAMNHLSVNVKEVRERRMRNMERMQALRDERRRSELIQRQMIINNLLADLDQYILDSKIQETYCEPLYVTLTDAEEKQLQKAEICRVLNHIRELGCSASTCKPEEICTPELTMKVTVLFISSFAMCEIRAGEASRQIAPSEIFIKILSNCPKEEKVYTLEDDEELAFKIASEQ